MLQLVAEVVSFLILECALRGPGYLICRLFVRKEELSVDHGKVLVAGFVFWVVVIAGTYAAYAHLAKPGA
jgi:DMSO reductase anchor subunit